ncbi:probable phytol kinase 1, chloroplastic [Impatiens glandulifera]|uniref:probable phytol kinase 1, chloroplastic n=1 Tax=Impatiens glandulifera TaxID=253017 RepID=UPI001FB188B0|nr:probable phytol kinase 1, chloroplastic [Impatiens glandulifera]
MMISATLSTVASRNVAVICLTAKSSLTRIDRIAPLYDFNPIHERTSLKTALCRQFPHRLNWHRVRDSKLRSSSVSVLAAVGNSGDILHDVGATALVMAGAYALVFVFDYLTQRSFIEQNLSRKLVHILSGLLFMFSWPIFSTATEARYFASLVPLANCLRLVFYGLSLSNDERLIKSVTREGKAEELLRGPLYYVLVLIACGVIFWRDSPIGVISLAMMCGGDGIADIIGRRFGSLKLPYNRNKSLAGSMSMFVFGFLVSIGMLFYFSSIIGYFELDWIGTIEKVALISLVATIVESLPTAGRIDDNISVPLSSMLIGMMCFKGI